MHYPYRWGGAAGGHGGHGVHGGHGGYRVQSTEYMVYPYHPTLHLIHRPDHASLAPDHNAKGPHGCHESAEAYGVFGD